MGVVFYDHILIAATEVTTDNYNLSVTIRAFHLQARKPAKNIKGFGYQESLCHIAGIGEFWQNDPL